MIERLAPQAEILWPAFVAGLLVLSTHVPLGREVLRRGVVFLDLAVAQIAAFGAIAAGILWPHALEHPARLTPIAAAAAIIGALALGSLRRAELRVQEAMIGIAFVLAASGGALLLAADPHGGERLGELLVGQILWIGPRELLLLAAVQGAALAIWRIQRARHDGWLFYPLFAVAITVSTQFIGVYLVFASLIIPALATLRRRAPLRQAFAIGATGYAAGLLASALTDWPAGPAIAWALALTALGHFCACEVIKRAIRGARAD